MKVFKGWEVAGLLRVGSCFCGISDWVLGRGLNYRQALYHEVAVPYVRDKTTTKPRLADSGEIGYIMLAPGIFFEFDFFFSHMSASLKVFFPDGQYSQVFFSKLIEIHLFRVGFRRIYRQSLQALNSSFR